MSFRRIIADRYEVTSEGTSEQPIVMVRDRRGPTMRIPIQNAVDVARALSRAIDDAVTAIVAEEIARG